MMMSMSRGLNYDKPAARASGVGSVGASRFGTPIVLVHTSQGGSCLSLRLFGSKEPGRA